MSIIPKISPLLTSILGPNNITVKDSAGNLVRDFGAQTFVANRTTYVGVDPVFLPDVRKNSGGWNSTITIRNNSSSTVRATVSYFYFASGDIVAQSIYSISPSGSTSFQAPINFDGAAVIMGSEDISVSVLHEHGSPYTIDGYAGVENPTATTYVPILHKNNNGWNSDLFIQNASDNDVTAVVNFIASTGNSHSTSYYLGPWGRQKVALNGISQLGTTFIGSAKVTSSQPLAVASTQFNGTSQLMATSNSQSLATTLHAPLIQNGNAGYQSGLTLLNASGSTQSLGINYYSGSGSNCHNQSQSTAAEKSWILYPAPPAGASCATTLTGRFTSGENLAVNVNQLQGTAQATTYAAVASPGKTVVVPRVNRSSPWNDGFVIRNTESSAASVTVQLYNTNGSLNTTLNGISVSGNGSTVVLGQMPGSFNGSAVITSNRNVAVSVNTLRNSGSGDIISSYPADHQ